MNTDLYEFYERYGTPDKKCLVCGHRNSKEDNYCSRCGYRIGAKQWPVSWD